MSIIGRKKQRKILQSCYKDQKSHFIALYGRRRVGKTYLIRQHFEHKLEFYVTGLANGDLTAQLTNFSLAMERQFDNQVVEQATTWLEVFDQLIRNLEKCNPGKKVIFIDELPWMDTPRSMFLTALEFFWNSWASARRDILLIACGSAASWMLNKLINNKAGLFNRVTRRIKLSPFSLSEVEKYLHARNYNIDRYQQAQLYMSIGGVPYYLDMLQSGLSVAQNLEEMFFVENAALTNEYSLLFKSLFDNSDLHKQIIRSLTKKKIGLTRTEILKHLDIKDGGSLTRALDDLIASDFIRKYRKFEQKNRDAIYQLIDPFTLFHHRFVEDYSLETNFWINQLNTPTINNWQGNAFEMTCLLHIDEIKDALGISGVQTTTSTWWNEDAQIDLVIDRKDQVINLVEIKFSITKYTITKAYDAKLKKKLEAFRQATKSKKALWTTMITSYGLKESPYKFNVTKSLSLDDLFLD